MRALAVLALLATTALAAVLFARRASTLVRLLRRAKPDDRGGDLGARLGSELTVVLGQRKLFQRPGPGLMHALIFWGFLTLLTTIAEAVGEILQPGFAIPLVGRTGWLGLVQDVFAVGVIVGVGMALWIRKVRRPERFAGSHLREADLILTLILGVVLTLLAWNGARIALGTNESPSAWTPASAAFGAILDGLGSDALEAVEGVLLWAHLVLILGFLAWIPRSKHLHILTAAPNVFFSSTRPSGRLRPLRIDLEAMDEEASLGAATAADLTWKELLDVFTCTECGRCQDVCPAWTTEKPLSPKLLIMDLRDHVLAQAPTLLGDGGSEPLPPLVPDAVEDAVVWDCTTCGACMRECPVEIEHVDHIVDLRRNLVMAESRFPREAEQLLRNLETVGNPWGAPASERTAWAEGLDVRVLDGSGPAPEVLYWVGCAGAFDDRARATSRAVIRVLRHAGVDVAILGPRERCTGDPARRLGHEYLFQTLAEENVATLDGAGVRTIVASCAHCFNTLRNEYPDYGGSYEVLHHTELFARLAAEGRLRPTGELAGTVAFHDPCYLGRHNGVYDDPRDLLGAVPGIETRELPRSRERSFCCGAGGARMWLEEHEGRPVNLERIGEVRASGADTLAVACPFCLVMLDDGAKAGGEEADELRVADVAVLLAESLGPEAEPAGGGPGR